MRRFCVFALAAGFLALGTAAVAEEKDDKEAAKKLEGTYIIIGIEGKGLKLGEDDLKKFGKDEERTLTIKGDQIVAKFGGKEDPATFKIDPSKNPPHINITSTKDGKKEVNYGIYKLEKDVLTISATEKGEEKDRPKDFKGDEKALTLILKKTK